MHAQLDTKSYRIRFIRRTYKATHTISAIAIAVNRPPKKAELELADLDLDSVLGGTVVLTTVALRSNEIFASCPQ